MEIRVTTTLGKLLKQFGWYKLDDIQIEWMKKGAIQQHIENHKTLNVLAGKLTELIAEAIDHEEHVKQYEEHIDAPGGSGK